MLLHWVSSFTLSNCLLFASSSKFFLHDSWFFQQLSQLKAKTLWPNFCVLCYWNKENPEYKMVKKKRKMETFWVIQNPKTAYQTRLHVNWEALRPTPTKSSLLMEGFVHGVTLSITFGIVSSSLDDSFSFFSPKGRSWMMCVLVMKFRKCIARNSEPLPPAKRDETLPYALILFIGKCMEMIV